MISSWWFLWMFAIIFLLPPLGYGWGYRGWGPPYPRYIQRRRGQAAVANGAAFNHQAWGWGGDFVWLMMLFGLFWSVALLWWR